MATAFGIARCRETPAEFLAPGDPATRAKKLPSLRFGQTVFASMKRSHGRPCWVAGSPAASACALFAPQPAHAQLRITIEGDPRVGTNAAWPVTTPRLTAAHHGLTPTPRLTGGTRRPPRNAVHGRVAARIKHRRPRWTVLRPSVACDATVVRPWRRLFSKVKVLVGGSQNPEAEGNCVAARRGGEQPKANWRSAG